MSNDEEKNRLFQEVTDFFTPSKFRLILPILLGEDIVAMSTLNYFVTNYSEYFSNFVTVDDKDVYIHKAYKKKLSKHKKFYFDAFCRIVKIPFFYDTKKYITTTVGQLNYYKWIVELDILTYVRNNHGEIYHYMKHVDLNELRNSESDSITITESTSCTDSENDRYVNKVRTKKKIKIPDDLS